MKPDICIYHGNCADGFGAAWAVWKRWGGEVKFVPGVYGAEPPDVAGKSVLMVDFSYKRPVLERLAVTALSLTILDHHKTAQEDLKNFAPEMEWNACRVEVVFDMDKSGAVLTWEYCFPSEPVPKLLQYIQDRDLWHFYLPHSREIAALLFSHPYDFAVWDDLIDRAETASNFSEMVAEGTAIERKHHKDIAELLAQTRRTMRIGGYEVPVANLPYTMSSDAAGQLAEGQPFAACYFDRNDGQRVFSLRSRGDGIDVSEVAKAYGGGGHRNAAGFQAPLGWEGEAA